MTEEKEKEQSGEISRREFLRDAGLVVGGAAIGSTVLLAACGDGEVTTETVTTTAPGATQTVTTTQQVGEVTTTVIETVSKFICPSCSQEVDTLAALKAHFTAAHPGEVVEVPGLVTLTVNGKAHELKVEPQWTLAKVIREQLGLTGTKVGCDIGECGNCTVHMDGIPVYSCLVLAVEAEGKDILTIEGIAEWSDGAWKLDKIQEAFVELDAIQCGWCVPGFIMSAKTLLDANPNPTQQEAMEAIAGNLCRCMGYYPIVDAILLAAKK